MPAGFPVGLFLSGRDVIGLPTTFVDAECDRFAFDPKLAVEG
jgi:hypothetical protein